LFKNTNRVYRRVKNIAEEYVKNLLTQNEAGYPKKVLIKIGLQSVLATLRAHPNRCDIIFNDNSPIISDEYHETIITMTQTFAKDLLNQTVEQTMATLESKSDIETEEEEDTEETEVTTNEPDIKDVQDAAASTEATKEEETNGMKN
jgi:hypothetical protein